MEWPISTDILLIQQTMFIGKRVNNSHSLDHLITASMSASNSSLLSIQLMIYSRKCAARKRAASLCAARKHATRECTAHEHVVHERATRERAARERATRERAAHKRAIRAGCSRVFTQLITFDTTSNRLHITYIR